ncbi:hypothetical protein J3R83DRAFT_4139 [Lanmaoa asiatica]|nr:hypothetical protein J3R83DRAFT_4139 [Lanmaoa asiatica]
MSAMSTPRSVRFDLPSAPAHSNSTPATDTGLAEWTNRIKAMQRQVDADDEAEQRRLEEEITRARLARMRRSRTGQSGDFGVGMHGIDLSKLQEGSPSTVEAELRTVTSSSELPSASTVSLPKTVVKPTSTGSKQAPMSLAAFMGGNASGPRLRRHEPQLNASLAYDGRGDHGSVHPIFGRGGVAMPGMVGREAGVTPPSPSAPTSVPQLSSSNPAPSTPQTASSEPSRAHRGASPQVNPHPPNPLVSGSVSVVKLRPMAAFQSLKLHPLPRFLRAHSLKILERGLSPQLKVPITDSRPKTPVTDIRPKTPTTPGLRPKTPVADPRSKYGAGHHRGTLKDALHIITLTDLCRRTTCQNARHRYHASKDPHPIQPHTREFPRSSSMADAQTPTISPITIDVDCPPEIPWATIAFPQYARTTASAWDVPRLPALQGRGFVQSIVQASDRFSGDPQGSPSTAPKHVFSPTSPASSQGSSEVREKGARRASVLDRWNPVVNANGNGTPLHTFPTAKSATPTRSYAAHMSMKSGQEQDISVVKTHDTGRSVRSAVSLPAIPRTPLKKSDGEEKLGSSSTMISYIKPIKTGDDPVVPDVDELGVKASEGGVQVGGAGTGTGTGGSDVNHGAVAGTNALPGKAKTPRVSVSPLPSSPGKPLESYTEVASQSPNPAVPSSTDPAPSPSDTSSAPASFGPRDSQPGGEPPVKISPPSSTGKITDRWTEPALIGIKPIVSSSAANRPTPGAKSAGPAGMVGRLALPGLANPAVVAVVEKDEKPVSIDKEERTTVPPSTTRHTRIPSTGNRALVMEVAQALSEAAQQQEKKEKEITTAPAPGAPASVLARQLPSTGLVGPAAEKRKSSFERYSAIAMPPLREERTPAASPANTYVAECGGKRVGGQAGATEQSPSAPSPKVHIDHADEPLPKLDVAALLKMERPAEFMPNPDLRMVSVEVMSVVHTSAVPVQRDTNIFYDAEVLVIVHRAKSRESGLVATKVWCWKGKKCHFGEKEEKKVGELARRYGTSADVVDQQRESAELVYVLGGQLAIRQGTRAHWSSENTAMHVVRSNDGHTLIDEIDLNIRNLCSGYSYCISILDNIYVWHGCGSVAAERTAALRYAQDMAAKGTLVKELMEGENDGDDEMFWMVVGDSESYAKADYWRWRSSVVPSEPRCWLVDVANPEVPIRPVPTVFAETVQQETVYIIDCSWEFFVLVGKDARAKRSDITLAINTAMAMAPLVAASKPFSPTVHVLILPTQLPLDMRHAFRNLDEFALNGGFVPDHMNILSTSEAIDHESGVVK